MCCLIQKQTVIKDRCRVHIVSFTLHLFLLTCLLINYSNQNADIQSNVSCSLAVDLHILRKSTYASKIVLNLKIDDYVTNLQKKFDSKFYIKLNIK